MCYEEGRTGNLKKRIGDRYDGYRLRNITAFNAVVPHIMPQRDDSQVAGELDIDVTGAESFLRAERAKGLEISFFDIMIAALVRTISRYPAINRFVAGRKLYARNKIQISFVAKKAMTLEGEDCTIKIDFLPTDTLYDVARKVHKEIELVRSADISNKTTDFANIIAKLPVWLVSLFVGLLKTMDKIGIMPGAIINLSPFHTSVFVTNFGSIGFDPIYHHIYNFGTTSAFIALGKYHTKRLDGEIVKRSVKIRYVADERISDGYEMSVALKAFIANLRNPQRLTVPPEKVYTDRSL
jgi:hypothetical protein